MGLHPDHRAWKTGAEGAVMREETATLHEDELIEKSRKQAARFADENAGVAQAFKNKGYRDEILNHGDRFAAAKGVARNEPRFVPDIIESVDEQAAFLVALAEELTKPQYNQ